jgi:hypothetical protein
MIAALSSPPVIGEFGQIAPEQHAARQPKDQRHDHAGRDFDEAALSGGKPFVRHHERHHDHRAGEGIARIGELPFQRREPRQVLDGGGKSERRQHDQESERKQRQDCDQHVTDRFELEQPPRAFLDRMVGAVERDAQAVDTAGREIDR